MPRSLRLFVFARHGESVLNLERRVNGDPTKATVEIGKQAVEFKVTAAINQYNTLKKLP